jgi:hypothetical protein
VGKLLSTPDPIPRKVPAPRWCPLGLSKTQCRRLQKLRKKEIKQENAMAARDEWFNQVRPMRLPKNTWREKRLTREERDSEDDSDQGATVAVRTWM